jgi:ABC-type multidrug transport system ATPase subunit
MLAEHKDKRVKELSGGMKRKLSLAMAIVTKPQLIILDEPTSGLDVESRKQVWELIKRIKQGRSIIMSSQHLEEADELSDRIVIMAKGELVLLDTPGAIKKNFGVGYKIVIEPHQDQVEGFATIKSEKIDPLISSFSQYDLLENKESTIKKLIYQISFEHTDNISQVLAPLERELKGLAYVDVEINSLEDAYVKIADGEKEQVDK